MQDDLTQEMPLTVVCATATNNTSLNVLVSLTKYGHAKFSMSNLSTAKPKQLFIITNHF